MKREELKTITRYKKVWVKSDDSIMACGGILDTKKKRLSLPYNRNILRNLSLKELLEDIDWNYSQKEIINRKRKIGNKIYKIKCEVRNFL